MAISVTLNNSVHQFSKQITSLLNSIFWPIHGTVSFMLNFLTNKVVVFSHLLYSNGSFGPQHSVDSTDCEGIC